MAEEIEVTYGESTEADISSLVEEGYIVYTTYENRRYYLSKTTDSYRYFDGFSASTDPAIYIVVLDRSDNTWGNTSKKCVWADSIGKGLQWDNYENELITNKEVVQEKLTEGAGINIDGYNTISNIGITSIQGNDTSGDSIEAKGNIKLGYGLAIDQQETEYILRSHYDAGQTPIITVSNNEAHPNTDKAGEYIQYCVQNNKPFLAYIQSGGDLTCSTTMKLYYSSTNEGASESECEEFSKYARIGDSNSYIDVKFNNIPAKYENSDEIFLRLKPISLWYFIPGESTSKMVLVDEFVLLTKNASNAATYKNISYDLPDVKITFGKTLKIDFLSINGTPDDPKSFNSNYITSLFGVQQMFDATASSNNTSGVITITLSGGESISIRHNDRSLRTCELVPYKNSSSNDITANDVISAKPQTESYAFHVVEEYDWSICYI